MDQSLHHLSVTPPNTLTPKTAAYSPGTEVDKCVFYRVYEFEKQLQNRNGW